MQAVVKPGLCLHQPGAEPAQPLPGSGDHGEPNLGKIGVESNTSSQPFGITRIGVGFGEALPQPFGELRVHLSDVVALPEPVQ